MGVNEKVKLKDIIKEKIKGYDTISNLIFTTYSLDIPFFETKLLPYLFDIDNHKGIRKQEYFIVDELNDILNKNEIKINVFCDNFINHCEVYGNYQIKQVTVDSYEKDNNLKEVNIGVFHPKLIIIIGKKDKKETLTLFVSSANLTTSGYAVNTEVLGILTIDDKPDIIEKIKENSNDIRQILENLATDDKLIITGINDKTNFLDYLNGKNLKIVTPFITNDMLTNEKFKDAEILLTKETGFSDGNKYNPSSKKLSVLDDREQFIHAKIYIMDDKVIVGSHNLTNKALLNKNVEASLIIDDKEIVKNFNTWFKKLKKNDYKYKIENESDEKDIDISENIIIVEEAILDFNTKEIKITLEKDRYYKISKTKKQLILDQDKSYKYVKINNYDLTLNKTNDTNIFSYNLTNKADILHKIFLNRFFELEIEDNDNTKYKAYGIFYIDNLPNSPHILLTLTYTYFDLLETAKSNKIRKKLNITNEENTNQTYVYEKDKYDIANIYITYNKITENLNEDKDKNKQDTTILNLSTLDALVNSFILEYKDNFEDKNLLYFLLTAKEIEIILNKYIIRKEIENILNKYNEFNKVFEELKKEAISKLKDEFKLKEKKAKELLDIYLDNLEVDYENNKRE